jgi:hypothetical protein
MPRLLRISLSFVIYLVAILGRLMNKVDEVHRLAVSSFQTNLLRRTAILEAALCGAHRLLHYYEPRISVCLRFGVEENPTIILPSPRDPSLERSSGRTTSMISEDSPAPQRKSLAEYLRNPPSLILERSIGPMSLIQLSPSGEDHLSDDSSSPLSPLLCPPFEEFQSQSRSTIGHFEDQAIDDPFSSSPIQSNLLVPSLTVVTNDSFEIASSISSSSLSQDDSYTTAMMGRERNWRASQQSVDQGPAHKRVRTLSEYLFESLQGAPPSQFPLKDRLIFPQPRFDSGPCLTAILARENRESRLRLVSPKSEQSPGISLAALSVESSVQSNHWKCHKGDCLESDEDCSQDEEDKNPSRCSFFTSSVEIDWEFEFQFTCSLFQSDSFSFHGSLWRISLERECGSVDRLRYLLCIRCLKRNPSSFFEIDDCIFTLCPSFDQLNLSPYVASGSVAQGQRSSSRCIRIGSQLLSYVHEGKIKINTVIDIRYEDLSRSTTDEDVAH